MMDVIILSGEIATGKSTLAAGFAEYGFAVASTSKYLSAALAAETPLDLVPRSQKQAFGEGLDERTQGTWVLDVIDAALSYRHPMGVVLDCARRREQVEAIRSHYKGCRVVHVHLEALGVTKAERFEQRGEEGHYEEAAAHPVEQALWRLREDADLVIDTTHCRPEDVLVRALSLVDKKHHHDRLVDVLVGGQYGSEGKGHVVSHIAPEYDVLVRVGGPNAGHTVLAPEDGKKTSFYHLPSGSLHAPHAKLVLGPGAVINIKVLESEAMHLGGLPALHGRLFIDPQANIITREDVEREDQLVGRVGSTGQGVGMATARKIAYRGDPDRQSLARDFDVLSPYLRPTLDVLEQAYRRGSPVLLEGTQGTGLSLHHGHYPYVTSRDTTVSGTAGEAGIPPGRVRKSVMVLRTNPIRVQSPPGGTSGPMGKETTWEEISLRAGVPAEELRQKEMTTTTKRQRRVAEFNWEDLRRAVLLNGPTDLALTFVDYIDRRNQDARRFEQLSASTRHFIQDLERVSGAPVSLITTRFHQRSIIDRRSWR